MTDLIQYKVTQKLLLTRKTPYKNTSTNATDRVVNPEFLADFLLLNRLALYYANDSARLKTCLFIIPAYRKK